MRYQNNLEILSEKFPLIYMLLVSKHKKEPLLRKNVSTGFKNCNFFKNNLDKLDTVFIYKCVDNPANFELKKWLKKKDKKLIFIEDDLDALQHFFHLDIANFFLKNENVSFYFFEDIKKNLVDISKKNISANVDVITYVKPNKKFQNIKQKILENSLISFFSNHDMIYSHKIFKNFIKNLENLKTSFLANKFKNKFKNRAAIICGAGPSLRYSYDKLKTMQNKALIIAGGSAITCLTNQNINPHFGVIIDPNQEEYKRMKEAISFEIPILYSTRVNLNVFNTFNGPTGYIKAAIASFFEVWLEKELKILGKYLDSKPDEKAMSVTTICVSLAKLFGCNPIILDGVDLAFSEDKYYASDITCSNTLDITQKEIGDQPVLLRDKNEKDVYSNLKWKIESEWFSIFAKKSKNIKFINATKMGLKIDNFEDISINEIEKKYLIEEFDFLGYIHSLSQSYMLQYAKNADFKALKLKLKDSFLRCQNYFKDIIKNDPKYLAILASEEIKDEIAYKYFLLEVDYTLSNFFVGDKKYQKLLETSQVFLDELNKTFIY